MDMGGVRIALYIREKNAHATCIAWNMHVVFDARTARESLSKEDGTAHAVYRSARAVPWCIDEHAQGKHRCTITATRGL